MATCKMNSASYLCALLLIAVSVRTGNAFVAPGNKQQQQWRQPQPWTAAVGSAATPPLSWSSQPLALFRRGKSEKDEDSDGPKSDGDGNEKRSFYSRFGRKEQAETPAEDEEEEETLASDPPPPPLTVATAVKEIPVEATPVPITPTPAPAAKEILSPAARAVALRVQAEKMRLEAERMDAELTLNKIDRLERKLAYAKTKETKGEGRDLESSVEDLQRELEILATKMMRSEETSKASATVTAPKPASDMREPSRAGDATPETLPARPAPWAPPSQSQSKETSQSKESLSPAARAASLRVQAEKMRLEALRMDAELTLNKIDRLERKLAYAKIKETKGEGDDLDSSVEDLQRELEILASKMRGEETPKQSATITAPKPTSATREVSRMGGADRKGPSDKMQNLIEPFSETAFQEIKDSIKDGPSFLIKTLATQVGMDFNEIVDVNTTELASRLDKMNRLDFSYSDLPRPNFSQKDIDNKKELLKELKKQGVVDKRLLEGAKGDDTELALLSLEQEYYSGMSREWLDTDIVKIIQGEEWLKPMVDMINKTVIDTTIETLYPQCMRKEGQTPTMPQMQQFVSDVLPKVAFSPISKPEPVEGGYIIRGTNNNENGDVLIEAIDKLLAKSSLGEKMTVLYTNDFSIFGTENPEDIDFEETPILYVTGPDIVREPRQILLSVVSAVGIASSWYLSIYPFLLNPALSQRVESDMALVDANMAPDLSWLTDLSVPLFYTFFGIQLLHDFAHQVVAKSYGIEATVPTFVPSLMTGITSSVTSFKEPPKNNEAMFDYSVSGPLIGMLASIAAIVIGSQLTLTGDPSLYPSLPIEILRQSTLGGGIIDSIIGNGVLSVPEAALGTPALAGMTIPLHPVVVAGYISLIVNALSILPIGTTDGGRMGLALFGRGAKLLVGNVALAALFFVGIGGSDLFLFYFAFCIACQAGNEIPARNEVDKVGFSRVGVATFAYVLALLSLIPFQ